MFFYRYYKQNICENSIICIRIWFEFRCCYVRTHIIKIWMSYECLGTLDVCPNTNITITIAVNLFFWSLILCQAIRCLVGWLCGTGSNGRQSASVCKSTKIMDVLNIWRPDMSCSCERFAFLSMALYMRCSYGLQNFNNTSNRIYERFVS